MLGRLVQFALTQRVLVSLLAVLLAAGGYLAFRGLPIDAFPDVSPTQVKIIVKAPGMTPEEVETRITAPMSCSTSSTVMPRSRIRRRISVLIVRKEVCARGPEASGGLGGPLLARLLALLGVFWASLGLSWGRSGRKLDKQTLVGRMLTLLPRLCVF